MNITPEFISCASERELLTLSLDEIIDGLMADYRNLNFRHNPGIDVPDQLREPRQTHSCILYAEAQRLAPAHLDLAKKLVLASLFDFSHQVYAWLQIKKEADNVAKKLGKKERFNLLEALARNSHYSTRPIAWLMDNGEGKQVETYLNTIAKFETFKEAERERIRKEEEERKMAR